jgi:ribosomal protein S18 acetylase RimI-like enzyme
MTRSSAIDLGSDRLRIGPWRGDPSIAYISPVLGRAPRREAVDRCLVALREKGYRQVLTSALAAGEQEPFLAAGFEVHEALHLLHHDLAAVPRRSARDESRRGRRRDEPRVLAVDALAFDPFWRFDRTGLADARSATPVSRFRVADGDREQSVDGVSGYAVTGRAGTVGYLQRLAVHPRAQRRGIGEALVVDSLRWARRRGAHAVMVNTQVTNDRALRLYQRLGFVRETQGLAVLVCALDRSWV